jgi:hypothetical protein
MKLDAGGSSQLWYNDQIVLDSDRGVADALLVFAEAHPRHANQLLALPVVPILSANVPGLIEIDVQNTGFLTWTPDRGYGLRSIGGATLTAEAFELVSNSILPGETARLFLHIDGSNFPGVYESTWQMIGAGESFGVKIPVRVIIIPAF